VRLYVTARDTGKLVHRAKRATHKDYKWLSTYHPFAENREDLLAACKKHGIPEAQCEAHLEHGK
jgi:hypothetical protein